MNWLLASYQFPSEYSDPLFSFTARASIDKEGPIVCNNPANDDKQQTFRSNAHLEPSWTTHQNHQESKNVSCHSYLNAFSLFWEESATTEDTSFRSMVRMGVFSYVQISDKLVGLSCTYIPKLLIDKNNKSTKMNYETRNSSSFPSFSSTKM